VRVRYIIGPDTCVDSNDRGLAYGDGLFETMAVRRAGIRFLDLHLDRLRLGCERLRLPLPDTDELQRQLTGATAGIDYGLAKLILTRGAGPRGYRPRPDPEPTVILSAAEHAPAVLSELVLVTLDQRLGENEKLAGIKHLCRLEQVLGQLELDARDADEGLMLSTSGAVIGGTSRNLFAVYGRRLVTPMLTRAGIAGVMRRAVLEQCATLGLEAVEAPLLPSALAQADELFMTNALVGIESVATLDGRPFAARSMAAQLQAALGLDDDA
jgi:4-amino-4-deoxychorismate lyase